MSVILLFYVGLNESVRTKRRSANLLVCLVYAAD